MGRQTQIYKVAIMGEMPAEGYSGGRYHAWVMAEALAHMKNQVYVITNHIPQFSRDFSAYPRHGMIRTILTDDFTSFELAEKNMDYVICVPKINGQQAFYDACLCFAVARGARFALINFETPNWYCALKAEIKRPEKDYEMLRKLCRHGCLVISSAEESRKYAEEFYHDFPKRTQHCVWSPPINSLVADGITEEKENQIMVFLRVGDKHKGGDDFLRLLGEYMRGMTCVCVVGMGNTDEAFLEQAKRAAGQYGVKLKFENAMDDYRKFKELKKSRLLLFPSHFEGYGSPPVEALYCGTKCIVYDLPVLREISGDALSYCPRGDISGMRRAAEQLLREKDRECLCVDTADFEKQARRLQHILDVHSADPKLKHDRNAMEKALFLFRYRCRFRWRTAWEARERKHNEKVRKYVSLAGRYQIAEDEIPWGVREADETWRRVEKRIKGKRIYIWGCGKMFQELYPKCKKRMELAGIVDRDTRKIGRKDPLAGILVQDPAVLREMEDKDSIAVLISNKRNVNAIAEELKEFGIREYHSLCMMENLSPKSRMYRMAGRICDRKDTERRKGKDR